MHPIHCFRWSATTLFPLLLLVHGANARVLLVDPEDIAEVRLLNESENERPFETSQYQTVRRRDESAVQSTSKPFDPLADFLNIFGIRTRSLNAAPTLVPRNERPPPPRFDPIGDFLNLARPGNLTPAPSLIPRSEQKKPDFDPFRDLIQLPVLKGTEQAISAADSVRQQLESINPLQNLFSPTKIVESQETATKPQPIVPLKALSNVVLNKDSSSTANPREGITRLNSPLETDIRKMFPPLFNILDNLGVPERQSNLDEIQIGRDRTVSVLGMPVGRRDGVKVAPLDGLTVGNQDVFGPVAVNDNYKVNWGFLGELGKFLDRSTKEIGRVGKELTSRADERTASSGLCLQGAVKSNQRAAEMGASSRRLKKELADIMAAELKTFRNIEVDENNLLHWTGLLVPEKEPYNKGAFKIQIDFPAEYPFKPPKLTFQTKIYHPNIDEKGQVCLPIIAAENWKPATKTEQVIGALVGLVSEPEPDHPLRAELAEEFTKDKKKFFKNAEEYTKKHAEKRPD